MEKDKIFELAVNFHKREKNSLNADDLRKIDADEIKLWAMYTGMGSDADIYIIKKDGSVFNYDHNKLYGYGADTDELHLLQKFLLEQGTLWERIPCMYSNYLYIRPADKAWLESLCDDLRLLSAGHPYACMECVCQSLWK